MEQLKHECGVAMIRLLKPLEYYEKKYGTWMYGLNKLYLLMEKQHNRGQEGAGLACVKLEANPGEEYMFRERALGSGAITEIFETVRQLQGSDWGAIAQCRVCQAYTALCGGSIHGTSALFDHRKIRHILCPSVSQKEQLAGEEPCPLR